MELSIGRFRGGFCVFWTESGKRRRYQLAARTRAEAEPEAVDVYRRETYRPSEVTISAIWEAYRTKLGTRPTAQTMYYTGKSILQHFGNYRPEQVTSDLCNRYTKMRFAEGRAQGTIHTELGHLRSALKYAQGARLIDHAPDIERPEKPSSPERYLSTEEVNRLINSAVAPLIRLAILLLLGTAGRVGAILELTWQRTDLENGKINLRSEGSATRKGRTIVPMNRGLKAALSQAKEARLSDFVIEYAGGPVRSIRKGFYNALQRAGIKGATIHTIRHTVAVHMVTAGIPMEKVAQFLGHSNSAITYSIYARYSPEHLQDAADLLDFTSARSAE